MAGTVSVDQLETTCPQHAFPPTAAARMLPDGSQEDCPHKDVEWSPEKFASTGKTTVANGVKMSKCETAADSTFISFRSLQYAICDTVEPGRREGKVGYRAIISSSVQYVFNAQRFRLVKSNKEQL